MFKTLLLDELLMTNIGNLSYLCYNISVNLGGNMSFEEGKLLITGVLTLLYICLVIFLILKHKLVKIQVHLLLFTVLFWSIIKIVRPFVKVVGNELSIVNIAFILSSYGLISIFIRYPLGIMFDRMKNKMLLPIVGVVILATTSLLFFIESSALTLLLSNLALGIGASIWAVINVLYSQTFSKIKVFQSIAILSVAPLIADGLTAPLQFFARENGNTEILWLFSSIIAVVTFCYAMIFLRSFKGEEILEKNNVLYTFKKYFDNKNLVIYTLIGILILMIRFAVTGANAQSYAVELGMSPFFEGYLSVVFSTAMLFGGLLSGTFLKSKFGVKVTLILGFVAFVIYSLGNILMVNPQVMFYLYSFSGFGYGIVYTLLLAMILDASNSNNAGQNMGIYQSFIAIGIFYGSYISAKVSSIFGSYQVVMQVTTVVIIIMIVLITLFLKKDAAQGGIKNG